MSSQQIMPRHFSSSWRALWRNKPHNSWCFVTIVAQEPSKREILAFEAGQAAAPPRTAFCILQVPPNAGVFEALVDLSKDLSAPGADLVKSWTKVSAGADA